MITVNETHFQWYEGMTVAALLSELADGHTVAVIKLNGRLVSRPDFASTPVPDGSMVILLPMIAGG